MLNSILLLLFFAFRRKTKHQQHLSSSVPLWGWIFVGAVAALGLVLLLRKKRAAQQESAGRVPVAVPGQLPHHEPGDGGYRRAG